MFAALATPRQDDILHTLDAVDARERGDATVGDAPVGEATVGEATAGGVTDDLVRQASSVFTDVGPGLFVRTVRADTLDGISAATAPGSSRHGRHGA